MVATCILTFPPATAHRCTNMQPAVSDQERLLNAVAQASADLARAASYREAPKCSRTDIDDLLVQKWALMPHVQLHIDGGYYTYSDSIRSAEYQPVRQLVWRMFLSRCSARPEPGHRITFGELMERIVGQLDEPEAHAVRTYSTELSLFWETLCVLADNVELDGKSDLVAVNAVLGEIAQRCANPLSSRYQPSGRLSLLDAVLKVMYHYAAGQPYQVRDTAHSHANPDRNPAKYRSLVAALCTHDRLTVLAAAAGSTAEPGASRAAAAGDC